MAVFPIGSANITNDLAIGLKTEIAIAEDIKKQYGGCMMPERIEKEKKSDKSKISVNQKIEVSNHTHSVSFTKKDLVDIIEPRVSEILDLMQKELKRIGRQELLPGGVVLTGGGAKIARIKELARERLRLPCRIGVPKSILGLEEDPALATVVGLVMSSPDFHDDGQGTMSLDFLKKWMPKFRKMFRVFIP